MPQELMIVYDKATGTPHYMHSVDAAEALQSGAYSTVPPEGQEADDAAKAQARARARGLDSPPAAGVVEETTPAVVTPEEKAPEPPPARTTAGVSGRHSSRSTPAEETA